MSDVALRHGASVHVAILRIVRQGKEAQFEEAIRRFIRRSLDHDETCGAQMLHPAPHSHEREYGVLRSFRSEADRDAFYQSPFYSEWERQVAELVEGPPVRRNLHGLEAFFRGELDTAPPPRWKMAFVTFLGVWPAALFWNLLLGQAIAPVHIVLRTCITSVVIVASLAWVIMPPLTRLFQPWLKRPTREAGPRRPHW